MRLVEKSGSEASYHFEEIATVAKEMGPKSRAQVNQHMQTIRQRFSDNLIHVRKMTGLPMATVASHGDFVNRILKIPNHELLNNELRGNLGIECEVYDAVVNRYVTSRHSDTHFPAFWKPHSPLMAIQSGEKFVYVVVHSRHWRSNIVENVKDNVLRLWEGIRYAVN
jgi:hypothetical protein